MNPPSSSTSPRQAIVLAAGEGRRLLPITAHTPKPLVPFFGKPLLDWAVDKLVAAGVSRIAVNAFHLAHAVGARVATLADRYPGVDLHVSHEPALLGTGGAVRHLRSWLTPGEPFFVLNSDAVFAATPELLVSAAARTQSAAALLVTRDPSLATERRLCAESGRLTALVEGPSDPDATDRYAFCGLTLGDADLPWRLPDGPSCLLRQGLVPYLRPSTRGTPPPIPVALVETDRFFADTGTPEALIDAHVRGYEWVARGGI